MYVQIHYTENVGEHKIVPHLHTYTCTLYMYNNIIYHAQANTYITGACDAGTCTRIFRYTVTHTYKM